MANKTVGMLLTGGLLLAMSGALLPAHPAQAAVYCTGVGVPAGCVVRPAPRAVAYCTRPGFPVGCTARTAGAPGVGVAPGVGAGAPGVGVTPGVGAPGVGTPGVGAGAPGVGTAPANRGGPVNRPGVR
jgi:hypothetical protein